MRSEQESSMSSVVAPPLDRSSLVYINPESDGGTVVQGSSCQDDGSVVSGSGLALPEAQLQQSPQPIADVECESNDSTASLSVGVSSDLESTSAKPLPSETGTWSTQLEDSNSVKSVCQPPSQTDIIKTKLRGICVFIYTNILISILMLVIALAVPLGLGCYSLIVVQPSPILDKSVKSFEIPNHLASRRYDALDIASSHMSNYIRKNEPIPNIPGIVKRSIREIPDDPLQTVLKHPMINMTADAYLWRIPDEYFSTGEMSTLPKAKSKSLVVDYSAGDIDIEIQEMKTLHNWFTYHNGNNNRKMLSEAAEMRREKRQVGTTVTPLAGRFYGVTQSRLRWRMMLIYLAQGDDDLNIFTRERLETIHKLEKSIMEQPGFQSFCYMNYMEARQHPNLDRYGGCAPLNTLLTYFYPSFSSGGRYHYDSLGDTLQDIDSTLTFAMTHDTFYWYVDGQINKENKKSRLLRSEVQFGSPLAGYRFIDESQSERFKSFVQTYVKLLSKASTDKVKVLYGGNELFDYMIDTTFWNDLALAFFALGFIVVFMFVLTSFSVWLTVWGILGILLSFLLAFVFYRVVFNHIHLGILNGAAAFVIIGIGVDDVFVFINIFRQSTELGCLSDRMLHTVWTAGTATFFTSATTAAAFAANCASSIPAVNDFGLFMSVIVACCWVMVMLIMPPTLNIWHRAFSCCERRCYGCCPKCSCGKCQLDLPDDIRHFQRHCVLPPPPPPSPTLPADEATSVEVEHVTESTTEDNINEQDGGWLPNGGISKQNKFPEPEVETPPPAYMSRENSATTDLNAELDPELKAGVCDPSSIEMQMRREDLVMEEAGQGDAVDTEAHDSSVLTLKLQALLYLYVARPVVRGRWFILGGFLVIFAVSVGLATQLKLATKPPQLFQADSNLQMLMDIASNFSHEGLRCDRCSGLYTETKPGNIVPTRPRQTTNTLFATPLPTSPRPTPVPATRVPSSTTTTKSTSTPQPTPVPSSTPVTKAENQPPTIIAISKTPPLSVTTSVTQPSDIKTKTTLRKASTTPLTTKTTTVDKRGPPDPPTTPKPLPSATTASSTLPPTTTTQNPFLVDPCADGKCTGVKNRPQLDIGASIYVVFGVKDVDRSKVEYSHVLTDRGDVVYDEAFFRAFQFANLLKKSDALRDLCRVCTLIAKSPLVRANYSQCIPTYGFPGGLIDLLGQYPECIGLPQNVMVNGRWLPSRAMLGYTMPGANHPAGLLWVAFAFESTTYKGQSYFTAYEEYQEWEKLIEHIRTNELPADSPLHNMYQTSEFWPQVMMETVAVSSAIYGLVLSLIICISLVALFTGHVLLLLVVLFTIIGVIGCVVAIFYLAGWEMGAVEAVSLSILVGSSVDYSVHMVEGYLLAGSQVPPHIAQNGALTRQWRTRVAVSHIGVSIFSSAITTIAASIPLTQTVIMPFSKFGRIVAINTAVAIFYTFTACVAFLATFAPPFYKRTLRSTGIALGVTSAVVVVIVLVVFVLAQLGYHMPGPSGEDIFPDLTP